MHVYFSSAGDTGRIEKYVKLYLEQIDENYIVYLKLNILFIVGEDANALLNLFVKDY